MANTRRHLFGEGLSFPPRVDSSGRLARSADEDNVRESIRIILMTEPGERVMREEFGCGLRRFLFEPNTVRTREAIREQVTRAVTLWEPRVAVEDVSVEEDSADPGTIAISIRFRLIATQSLGRVGLMLQLEG